jgi:hypothetical protein
MSSHATTLTDILHVKQVSMTSQQAESAGLTELLDPGQQAKVSEIDGLLIEVGAPTVDEELDATITALTDMRDDSGSGSVPESASALESTNAWKVSYNAWERFSMFMPQNYSERAGDYVRIQNAAMAQTYGSVYAQTYGGTTIAIPSQPGAGFQWLRPGRFMWEVSVSAVNLPLPQDRISVEVYDPTGWLIMASPAQFVVEDPADAATWWPTVSGDKVDLAYHGVPTRISGTVNVFNPGDAPPSVAALVTSLTVGDSLQIWFNLANKVGTSDMNSVIMECKFTQLAAEPSRGEPTPEQLAADAAMRLNTVSGLASAKAAAAEAAPT